MAVTKEDRIRFGKSGQPIPATRVFVRDMEFDHEDVRTQSWILINEEEGTRSYVNSYDGNLGVKNSPQVHPYSPDDKKFIKKLDKEYEEVDIKDCPFAILTTDTMAADDEDLEDEDLA